MPKSQRLKVFQAQFGFYDTVVAASSQAAALRAWGTHQNLFESGQARVTDDQAATDAALKHPEMPLRRPIGSKDEFALDPTGSPVIPEEKRAAEKPVKAKVAAKTKSAPAKDPPDRSKLDAAEKALDQVEDDRKREEATFARREDELAAEREAAQSAYVARRKKVAAEVEAAKRVYRAAGG